MYRAAPRAARIRAPLRSRSWADKTAAVLLLMAPRTIIRVPPSRRQTFRLPSNASPARWLASVGPERRLPPPSPASAPRSSRRFSERTAMAEPLAYLRDGAAIYERSFAIIRAEADLAAFSPDEADIVVRMIHACGLVKAAQYMVFVSDLVGAARRALAAGAPILCDAEMVA